MAIVPLQLARVSNALTMGLAQRSLTRTQQSLLEVQNELSSGKRINVPSDDPAGASAAAQLRRTLAMNAGYATNLKAASSQLGMVDSTLSSVTDLLQQAQSIASANVGNTVTADARTAAASLIDGLSGQILGLANQQFQGAYLFGGQRAGQQPFVTDSGGVRFAGSDTVLQNTFDAGAVLPFMVSGNDVFGALSTCVQGATDLTPVVRLATRVSDLNGATGQGVRLGAIQVGNGTQAQTIDLSGCDTVSDVINAINAAGVGGITAAISPAGTGIMLSGGPTDDITVTEASGTAAADLGILTTTGGGVGATVFGQPVRPRVTPLTRLSDLRGSAGIDANAGLIISNGSNTATINLASVSNVEGLINAINASGTGAVARINADASGIDVLNSVQGTNLTIAENGGATATDLGIRTFAPSTPVSELNGGKGVRLAAGGPDLRITRRDGTSFQVDFSAAATVQDAIDAINAADGGGGVTASFKSTGNGIVLTDSTGGAGSLSAANLNYSNAAEDLGLNVAASGAAMSGTDVNGIEAAGVFGNLAKLRDALLHSDQGGITAAAEALAADQSRVIRVRGQAAAVARDFDQRQQRLEDQDLATTAMLSGLEDTDYNEAVTRFQTLQTALQANLQTTGRLLNLSLLDFLG